MNNTKHNDYTSLMDNSLSPANRHSLGRCRLRRTHSVCFHPLVLPVIGLVIAAASGTHAQIPTVLTDKIHKGSGVIDIMQDVSASDLNQYIDNNGGLILGIDLNENAAGNESADSVGIAIKQLELVLTTSDGVFTFDDFYTSTTALIVEEGASSAEEFHVLFGTAGSSEVNGGTAGFDLSIFDDVIRLENVSYTGDILDAQLTVAFLDTEDTGIQGNETFFDFSNGFEDFAILTEEDAQRLEAADLGVDASSPTVSFQETSTSPPGAPLPPLHVMTALASVLVWRMRRAQQDA